MDEQRRAENAIEPEPVEAEKAVSSGPVDKAADAPQARYAAPEIDDDDDDDAPTEWVPTRFEKRVKAIPEKQWTLYQVAAGIAIGAFAVFALTMQGNAGNVLLIAAVALAIVLPRWLEERGRRSVGKARVAMIVVMLAGIVGMVLYTGLTKGFGSFFAPKDSAAIRMFARFLA